MSGASDYVATLVGRWVTGQRPMPALPEVWMALFATLPSDSNIGGTELSGNGYGRAQVSGQLAVSAAVANGAVLNFTSVPAWIVPGMSVFSVSDETSIANDQTVAAVDTIANTVTLSTPIDNAIALGDVISFSAYATATGSNPSIFSNVGPISFPLTTMPGPGTAYGWGFFDAETGGNLLVADTIAGGAQVISGNVSATFAEGQLIVTIT
jgi:hypothetical protein